MMRRWPVWMAALGLVLAAAANGAEEEPWQRRLKGDLSTRLAPPLEIDQRQRDRAMRLDQLDRLLLPLLPAKELKDADKTRLGELSKERDALQAELARDAAELSRREVYALERIQKQLPADAALVSNVEFIYISQKLSILTVWRIWWQSGKLAS